MLGAITGDIIGAPYEHRYWSAQPGFELFGPGAKPTDDTVLTIAVAEHCLAPELDLEEALRRAYHRAPTVGFSKMFKRWVQGTLTEPYRSFGNGSAMRVSPIAWAHDTLDDVVAAARLSALPTHGHPEGIRGAEVIAGAIFLARTGSSRDDIRAFSEQRGYTLEIDREQIKRPEVFLTCQATVPAALVSFLETDSFEAAIRHAVLIDGDTDTHAAITGSVAEAYYGGVPTALVDEVWSRLKPWMRPIVEAFCSCFMQPRGLYVDAPWT